MPRRQLVIDEGRANSLLEIGFSGADVAKMMQVSARTLRRRIGNFRRFTAIHNADLDAILVQIRIAHPTAGYQFLDGYLRADGIRVSQRRLRKSYILQLMFDL
jgi:hypothetical protein